MLGFLLLMHRIQKLMLMAASTFSRNILICCSYLFLSHTSSMGDGNAALLDRSVGQVITVVQTEMCQRLLEGLSWKFVQSIIVNKAVHYTTSFFHFRFFFFSSSCKVTELCFPSSFHQCHRAVHWFVALREISQLLFGIPWHFPELFLPAGKSLRDSQRASGRSNPDATPRLS